MPTSIRLDKETEERLDKLAREIGRSRAFYLREAIQKELPRLEWEYGLQQKVSDVRAGKAETYGLEEARVILELEDQVS